MSLSAGAAARDRLRIAIQNRGRLGTPARALLSACGLTWREAPDQLFYVGEDQPIDLLLVRDDDIPGLVAERVCDIGIVGRNTLVEEAARRAAEGLPPAFNELRALGCGECRLDLAIPIEWNWRGPADLAGLRIATSHPFFVAAWLRERAIDASVVPLAGSVEIAPSLGQADVVCDLVSSGATLAANRLKPVLTLLKSEAVLAAPITVPDDARRALADMLLQRIDGALRIGNRRLVTFEAEREQVAALLDLLTNAEPPTMMRIDGSEMLAFQTVCHGALTWKCLEDLSRAGARRLMVAAVERMLA
jgi:ATP phosphoribosyltransferase